MKYAIDIREFRIVADQIGQALPWVALTMAMILAFAGLSIDAGHVFFCHRQLQAATDAAALAGAQDLPNSTATTTATSFSAVSGNKNALSNLGNAVMVSGFPKALCLTTLKDAGMGCVAPANANAIQVKTTASIPTLFMGFVGVKTINITATATASMRGSAAVPYNVAIVVDATASMGNSDPNCKNVSRKQCAMYGVQTLLAELYPCSSSYATCPTDGTNSVDRVSLFTYPSITVDTAKAEYCGGGSLSIVPYSFPAYNATSYAPSGTGTATYMVTSWLNDYRTSDTTSGLNPLAGTSNLVKAVNGNTKFGGSSGGCSGMQNPGGEGTYFAGTIYAAQAALVAEQKLYSGSQNALIILSDGAANAKYYTTPKQNGNGSSSGTNQMASKDVNNVAITGSGLYPSYNNQCAQAVLAAQYATNAGTKVFAVAYGGTTKASDCSTDNPSTTPCLTMQNMASDTGKFYSDTCANAMDADTIEEIFTNIGESFTVARLIPDDVT